MSYTPITASQFFPDVTAAQNILDKMQPNTDGYSQAKAALKVAKLRKSAFFTACAQKEKNFAYLNKEINQRAKLTPRVFMKCAELCSGDDYPSLKGLPFTAFDIIIPADGLQSCHLEELLNLSNGFLHQRLFHFNEWCNTNPMPTELAVQQAANLAVLQQTAYLTQAASAAPALAAKVQQLQQYAGAVTAAHQELAVQNAQLASANNHYQAVTTLQEFKLQMADAVIGTSFYSPHMMGGCLPPA
jgi:hypothetical protein